MLGTWLALLPAHADDLQLVLNDPSGRTAPRDSCDVALCTTLVDHIDSATKSIEFAFYGMRNQSAVLAAMQAAEARGVVVRGVVDMDVENRNYYASTPLWMKTFSAISTDYVVDQATMRDQRNYDGITYRCVRPEGFLGPLQCLAIDLGDTCFLSAHASREEITFTGEIMHNKFVIVDERSVWTGSTNLSDSGTGGYNANMAWVIDSPTVAGWYGSEFAQMFDGGRFHNTKDPQGPMRANLADNEHVELLFSPQHRPITNAVLPAIRSARDRIDVAVFFLTHKKIAQELIWAHNRGVKVRVILDATAAKNGYTKHEVLRTAGIAVKVEDWGGKMHAKSAVIDGEIVIAGSMNWTNAGEYTNDENTLIVRSKRHAAQYAQWFDGLWKSVPDTWLAGRPDPESKSSGTACTDGVDNDHDELADADDPGCSATPPPLPALPPFQVARKATQGATCRWEMREREAQ